MNAQATEKLIEDAKAKVLPFIHPQKDKPRSESLVLMRVVNRGTLRLMLGNLGSPCEVGESYILAYETDVPIIQSLVENDSALVEHARRQYELAIAEQVRSDTNLARLLELSAAQVLDLIKSKADVEVNAAYEKVLTITDLSFERTFQAIAARGIKPLDAAEVIQRGIPEIQRANTAAESDRLVNSIVTGMSRANAELVAAMGASIGDAIGKALDRALGSSGDKNKR